MAEKKLSYDFHVLTPTLFNVWLYRSWTNVYGDVTPTIVKIQNISTTPRPLTYALLCDPHPSPSPWHLPFPEYPIDGITACAALGVCLLALRMMHLPSSLLDQ